MKHIIILLTCLMVSVVVAFYDQLPLPDGGLFKAMKHMPWLFDFPVLVGMLFTPKSVHGVSPLGFGFGFFLQSGALIYGLWLLVWLLTKRFAHSGG